MPYPWSAGNVLTATDLNSSIAAKTDTAMVQNAQTGTSYSYALADASKLLSMSNAASNTVLVTKQATVTWVTGTQLRVVNLGAGVTTLVADTGVTINGNVALKQYQGGTLIRTASDVWLFVPTASGSGMDLITPTSVAGTGVTLSGGQVSFSAATSVSVNGCFSAAYLNYLVLLSSTNVGNVPIRFRMRLAGTDATGATDYRTGWIISTSAGTGADGTSAASNGISSGYIMQHQYDGNIVANSTFGSPFVAAPTNVVSSAIGSSTTRTDGGTTYSQHILGTSYDGLTVFPASGSITGTLRIYGLRNS